MMVHVCASACKSTVSLWGEEKGGGRIYRRFCGSKEIHLRDFEGFRRSIQVREGVCDTGSRDAQVCHFSTWTKMTCSRGTAPWSPRKRESSGQRSTRVASRIVSMAQRARASGTVAKGVASPLCVPICSINVPQVCNSIPCLDLYVIS
jgi:hypothetical protein